MYSVSLDHIHYQGYKKKVKITFLGTGTSYGIPVIGCNCPTCTSSDPRDQRTRSSVLIEEGNANLLIDVTPEFRLQAVRTGINRVDAVLITHPHSDHIGGFDDIRPLCRKKAMPVFGNEYTIDELRKRFDYIFRKTQEGGGKPKVLLEVIEGKPFRAGGVQVQPVPVFHGNLEITAYRIGPFAYVTDCSEMPPESVNLLKGCRVLVINGLRYRYHPTHLNIAGALEYIQRIKPERAFITHLCHDIPHQQLVKELPSGTAPARDGLEVIV